MILALGVAAIVAMMIVPLPTIALDILITLNLTIALTLLLVAIYVKDALKIATFPTILLITTLFRLGLNISSTRLILLQADAGQVIDAFGAFVVQGNYIVGAVVFFILLVVQFVVIARGSERVAEVAARFTLDALPGRQMAIDADLRSGVLDRDGAAQQRRQLQRESQFYGAMDGAMKFVKGDAIAGILITVVNIGAGLAIGVLQRGFELGEALRVFGLLTIGDGLVSQIPALIISTAAGLVITRVAAEEEGAHLGEELAGQVLAHPRALAIVAGLLALLALIPGLPTIPFLLLALTAGVTAWSLKRSETKRAVTTREDQSPLLRPPEPLSLVVGRELAWLVAQNQDGSPLSDSVDATRDRLALSLGLRLPTIVTRCDSVDLAPRDVLVLVDEIPEARLTVEAEMMLCRASADELMAAGLAPRASDQPPWPPHTHWIPKKDEQALQAADIEVLPLEIALALVLERVIRRKAARFVGVQETQAALDELERSEPALVRAVVPKLAEPPLIAEIFRRLVEEGVSIRSTRLVLEAILQWGGQEQDPVELAELVRNALARQLTHQLVGEKDQLEVLTLEPEIEDVLRDGIRRSEAGTYLALPPRVGAQIIEAITDWIPPETEGDGVVILTQADVRRFLRKLLERSLPELAVVSHQDLEPSLILRTRGQVGISQAGGVPQN